MTKTYTIKMEIQAVQYDGTNKKEIEEFTGKDVQEVIERCPDGERFLRLYDKHTGAQEAVLYPTQYIVKTRDGSMAPYNASVLSELVGPEQMEATA